MGFGSLASALQPNDPCLDQDAPHPLAGAALLSRAFQPVGRRVATTDAGAPPFLGPVPNPAAPTLARICTSVVSGPSFAFDAAFII